MKKRKWVKFRHKLVPMLLRHPIRLLLFLLYGLRTERFDGWRDGRPCFILGNHTTPLDPLCLGTSFRFPIYYVASDHVLRQGFAGKLVDFLVAPIPIVKSRLDLQTIKDMLQVVREGGSVCLFPEGNRNFNGETLDFPPSVAKLAKQLGIPLVLYRLEGGYLTAPRWADSIRRGGMTGRVARVVSPEEMKAVTVPELHKLIRSVLSVNDYDNQQKRPVRHRGKRPAEALERALYLCPGCMGLATMKSEDDKLSCGCGLVARYTDYGYLEQAGERDLPFRSVLEWDRWQKAALPEWLRAHAQGQGPLVSDCGQMLYECERAGSNKLLCSGRFSLYPGGFRFDGEGRVFEFPLDSVSKAVIHGKQSLQFTVACGITYEVRSPAPRSALKYLNLFELIKNKDNEVQHGLFSI